MKYVVQAQDNLWSTKSDTSRLGRNEVYGVTVMVEQNGTIFKSTEYIKIVEVEPLTTTKADRFYNQVKCEVKETINSDGIRNCTKTLTHSRTHTASCQGELLFDESFDNASTLNTIWSYDIRNRVNTRDEEFVVFNDSPTNCFVADGSLNIVPTENPRNVRQGSLVLGRKCTAISYPEFECNITAKQPNTILPPIYTSRIHSWNKLTFRFGRIEIRAKMSKGDWLLPYIILQPITTHAETYRSNEIRVAGIRGNLELKNSKNEEVGGRVLFGGTVEWQGNKRVPHMQYHNQNEHFGDDYHIYSLRWEPDSITFSVDATSYGRITENLEQFRQECFIIIGVSAGGHYEFEDGKNKPWENLSPQAPIRFWRNKSEWTKTWQGSEVMKIDYIRVYAV